MRGPFCLLVFDVETPLGCRDLFRYLRHNDCKHRLCHLGLNFERQRLDHAPPGGQIHLAGATDFDYM